MSVVERINSISLSGIMPILAAGKKPKFVLHNLTEATPQQLLN